MEKNKFYSKPLMVLEEFTPQEFVAGCNKPISKRSIVAFPQPDGPNMDKNSPF